MILNALQIKDYIGKLEELLTIKQANIIQTVATLLGNDGKANLKQVLEICYPGKMPDEAMNSLRGVRKKINDSAKKCGIEFTICVTDDKRSGPDQRYCWFDGADLSREKMEQIQDELLRNNSEYLAKDFTRPMGRSQFRIFVSSSDNRGAEAPTEKERQALEDFLRRLRHTLKAMGRNDLADGIYHFREQQDNLMLKRIEMALDACELGLLLISKPYLASEYVKTVELPRFNPVEYAAGKPGVKDAVPLFFSPCFDNAPAQINHLLGLDEGGGLQILRYQAKLAFTECDDAEQEKFVELIAKRLCQKLPPYSTSDESAPKRLDHLTTFTRRQRDKLNTDSSYSPNEWEPTRCECGRMERAGTSPNPLPAPVEEKSKGFDALERLMNWAKDAGAAHVHALLGDLGSGKTFTCRMLALSLLKGRQEGDNSIFLPIYIDLREVGFTTEWQSAPTLDNILEGWLKHWHLGVSPEETHGLDVEAVYRLSQAGAIWIFDGFDEISTHLPRNGDTAFFRELLRPIAPHKGKQSISKVLISCRSHYFPTLAKQNATLLEEARGVLRPGAAKSDLAENPELICDNTLLLPFDEEQIKNYLVRTLGESEAERAIAVIAGIHDLTELSRQPYLLRLIRGQIAQLEIMKSQGKPVNAASLYGLFVTDWLQRDEGKHVIEPEDKLRLMERLAAKMWIDRQRGWSFDQLQRWVLSQMEAEPDWRFRYRQHADLIAKDLHTAAFVVRYGECNFRFIHTSMQEYFVAAHLLRSLREGHLDHWDIARVSRETLAFLADLWKLTPLNEQHTLLHAQKQLHATPSSPTAALLALDYLLAAREAGWPHTLPDSLDLSGTDIGQRALVGEPTQQWRINQLCLNHCNGPQLVMKHLAIKQFEARQARLVGSCWEQCTIEHAELDATELAGAKIRHCDWQVASADNLVLRYAELRHSIFNLPVDQQHDRTLVPPWWLSREPAPRWAVAPQADARLSTLEFAANCHDSSINSVAWSHDGSRLATAGWDGSVMIWDAASGTCLITLLGHMSGVNSIAWRNDDQQIVSGSADNTVRIWDSISGNCLRVLNGHDKTITKVAWRGDGQQIISAAFDNTLRIWDASSGVRLKTLKGHSDGINDVVWCCNDKQVASAGGDGSVKIWSVTKGKCLMTLKGHVRSVQALSWCSTRQELVSAGMDKTLKIWDVKSGICQMTLEGHTDVIMTVAWRRDCQQIASAGWDGTIHVWDVASGACMMTLGGGDDWVNCVTWHNDCRQIAVAEWNGAVRIWDTINGSCLQSLKGKNTHIRSVAWKPDGQQFASSGNDNTVRIWDAVSGACRVTLEGCKQPVISFVWSSDGLQLTSIERDNLIRIWDSNSGVCLLVVDSLTDDGRCVALRSDGQQFVIAGWDKALQIWDVSSRSCLVTLHADFKYIESVAWSKDGRKIATAGWGNALQIWDTLTGTRLLSIEGNTDAAYAMDWHNDNRQLAHAGRDNKIRIYDTSNAVCLMNLEGHTEHVRCVAWCHDGKRLASAGDDNMIRIWDTLTGTCLMMLEGHSMGISSVDWRYDDQQIVSAGGDGTMRIWDTTSGMLIYQCIAIGDAAALLNADGEILKANDACWPYLARMGNHPITGERMWIPAETNEVTGFDGQPPH